MGTYDVLEGDCRETIKSLDEKSINCIVTSPPYYQRRDYEQEHQIGLEQSPEEYIETLVSVFDECQRVLADDGVLWVNITDTYRNKRMLLIPQRFVIAMEQAGWIPRQDIIWSKRNPMPEPVKDRCTRSHEYIFMFVKSRKYWFDNSALTEQGIIQVDNRMGKGRIEYDLKWSYEGDSQPSFIQKSFVDLDGNRNKRSVWHISTSKSTSEHFAIYPPDLIEPCILSSCPPNGLVLDPFGGSGTTAAVAIKHNRNAILCELNPDYIKGMKSRIKHITGLNIAQGENLNASFGDWFEGGFL
jgi:DNA modification methylase